MRKKRRAHKISQVSEPEHPVALPRGWLLQPSGNSRHSQISRARNLKGRQPVSYGPPYSSLDPLLLVAQVHPALACPERTVPKQPMTPRKQASPQRKDSMHSGMRRRRALWNRTNQIGIASAFTSVNISRFVSTGLLSDESPKTGSRP